MTKRNQLRVSTKRHSHGLTKPVFTRDDPNQARAALADQGLLAAEFRASQRAGSDDLHLDEVSGVRDLADPASVTRLRITMTLPDEEDGLPHFDDGKWDLGDSDGG